MPQKHCKDWESGNLLTAACNTRTSTSTRTAACNHGRTSTRTAVVPYQGNIPLAVRIPSKIPTSNKPYGITRTEKGETYYKEKGGVPSNPLHEQKRTKYKIYVNTCTILVPRGSSHNSHSTPPRTSTACRVGDDVACWYGTRTRRVAHVPAAACRCRQCWRYGTYKIWNGTRTGTVHTHGSPSVMCWREPCWVHQ